ncbi:hypothetical protein V1478_000620 [Vespula squamosa]|uniref:Uncharacterized protein n=1 Tax=Vespula squamosa TaxID=30214 RepID=A0ABD2C658_VESSQ
MSRRKKNESNRTIYFPSSLNEQSNNSCLHKEVGALHVRQQKTNMALRENTTILATRPRKSTLFAERKLKEIFEKFYIDLQAASSVISLVSRMTSNGNWPPTITQSLTAHECMGDQNATEGRSEEENGEKAKERENEKKKNNDEDEDDDDDVDDDDDEDKDIIR